jgi:hypothetical protein
LRFVKVAIFGSCVTRDVFEDAALRPALAAYTSRSVLASVVAPSIPLDDDDVPLASAFQRRCVAEDFRKTFFPRLAELRPDWLVVDLIDERFEIVQAGPSRVTRSLAFVEAGFDALFRGGPVVRRLTDEADALTVAATAEFARRVCAVVPPERVVIHRAGWMTRYRDGDELKPFPLARQAFAERHNAALGHMYDGLAAAFGGAARELDLGGDGFVADARHRWGLEPYHYERGYNVAAARGLCGVFG